MKALQIIVVIAASLLPISVVRAESPVVVEGKVIEVTTKKPIGAFTVKAYAVSPSSGASALVSTSDKPFAQTLTRIDGTYSLPIVPKTRAVALLFDKLSYFSVPPQQIVQLTSPKTQVPDVAAMKYSHGQTVVAQDLLDALSIREASFNMLASKLSPTERAEGYRKMIGSDLERIQKAGVDSETIIAVKRTLLPP